MSQGYIGHKILFHVLAPRGAGAPGSVAARLMPIARGFRPRCRDQRRQSIDVIVMGMGNEDMGEAPPI
jgi:hypothetical protein